MAQHFDVTDKLPEKTLRSLRRIIKYIDFMYVQRALDAGVQTIYGKEVYRLPKEYADFSFSTNATRVGPYQIDIPDLCKGKANLEVHHNGKVITKIYLPL